MDGIFVQKKKRASRVFLSLTTERPECFQLDMKMLKQG